MKRQQIFLLAGGLALFSLVYFFGNTVPNKKKLAQSSEEKASDHDKKSIEDQDILRASAARLSPGQLSYVNRLENSVVRGDIKSQQLKAYKQLAAFWRDSVKDAFLPAAYYTSQAAKLENSEKSLTFAAHLFLDNLAGQDNQALKIWMANQAKDLFTRALQLNPGNDSSKIGLGGSYIFGGSGDPAEVMQGIQQLLEVARRDSTNMYAQLFLGLGGIESGQFDKAIERLSKVVQNQPSNTEAILSLAEAYERKGDRKDAIRWYEHSKQFIANPDLVKAIDQRIQTLE